MPDSPSIRRPPGPRPVPLRTRFERHIERQPSGCWRWTGYIDQGGHPRIRVKRGWGWVDEYAYRVAWELAHGEPPAGDLRETCGHAWCVNPEHRIEMAASESRRRNVWQFWHEDAGAEPAEEE